MTTQCNTIQVRIKLDARTEHVYPIHYLQDIKNLNNLQALHERLYRRARPNRNDIDGAWAGLCALGAAAHNNLRAAKADGKLLMCWEGSDVVNLPKGGVE
jgi:hypothetical protein